MFHLLALVIISIFNISFAIVSTSDYNSLKSLYEASAGDNWRWSGKGEIWVFDGSSDPCINNWEGVTCALSKIVGLQLIGKNMTGYISPDIGNLIDLVQLTIMFNKNLTGTIPPSISKLTNLQTLELEQLRISGELGEEICSLSKLSTFEVSSTKVSGTIPSCIIQLTSLQDLYLDNNLLTGTIPSYLFSMSSLHTLSLSRNRYTQSFPTAFCSSKTLTTLHVFRNFLTGVFPNCVYELTSLQVFDISRNFFTGSAPLLYSPAYPSSLTRILIDRNNITDIFPSEICNISSLIDFNIVRNRFYGTIPTCIADLSGLTTFNIKTNNMTGTIPYELLQMTSLQYLYLGENSFIGTIPPLYNLTSLIWLDAGHNPFDLQPFPTFCSSDSYKSSAINHIDLAHCNIVDVIDTTKLQCLNRIVEFIVHTNRIYGSIPQDIDSVFPLVVNVEVGYNQLSGVIPDSITSLTNLATFSIIYNNITGTIPTDIGHCQSLRVLVFSENHLTGKLPESMFTITVLDTLELGGNDLSGTIPTSFAYLERLNYINLFENSFSGNIPGEFFINKRRLRVLIFTDNMLTGHIPTTIANCPRLHLFYLNGNMLDGTIPSIIFEQVTTLAEVGLSKNMLSGTIPEYVFQLPNINYVNMSENNLHGHISSFLCDNENIQYLYLSNNMLSGTISNCFTNRSLLTEINLSYNRLKGKIPKTFSNIRLISVGNQTVSGLSTLILNHNKFTGELPIEIFSIPFLKTLLLSSNHLTGHIPTLTTSTNLSITTLDISGNLLTGEIPDNIFYVMPDIISFSASSNCFDIIIPSSICDASNLEVVVMSGLSDNNGCEYARSGIFAIFEDFTSYSLKSCIFKLPNIRVVNLAANRLTGTFPKELGSSLREIILSRNMLSERIPWTKLKEITLSTLQISENRFSGSDGDTNKPLNISNSLKLYDNRFSGYVPQVTDDSIDMDVLNGNLFDCNKKHDVPSNDPYSSHYVCASDQLKFVLIVFFVQAISIFLCAIICALIWKSLIQDYDYNVHTWKDQFIVFIFDIGNMVCRLIAVDIILRLTSDIITVEHIRNARNAGARSSTLASDISTMSSANLPRIKMVDLSLKRNTGDLNDKSLLPRSSISQPRKSEIQFSTVRPRNSVSSTRSSQQSKPTTECESFNSLSFGRISDNSYNDNNNDIEKRQSGLSIGKRESDSLNQPSDEYSNPMLPSLEDVDDVLDMPTPNTSPMSLQKQSSQSSQSSRSGSVIELLSDKDISTRYRVRSVVLNFAVETLSNTRDDDYVFNPEKLAKICNVRMFMRVLAAIQTWCFTLGFLIICVCMPTYVILKAISREGYHSKYATHDHQYIWEVSAAYITGLTPSFIIGTYIMIMLSILTYLVLNSHNFMRNVYNFYMIDYKKISSSLSSSFQSSFVTNTQSSMYANQYTDKLYKTTLQRLKEFLIRYVVITFDTAVVFIVNALYVKISVDYESKKTVMEITLAIFRLLWSIFAVPALIAEMSKYGQFSPIQKSKTLLTISIIDSVIAPVAAALVSESTCFGDYFFTPETLTSNYSLQYCQRVNKVTGNCIKYNTEEYSFSFPAPALYNYQCASSVLTAYVSVVIYTYAISLIVAPLFFYVIGKFKPHNLPMVVSQRVPWILWPDQTAVKGAFVLKPDLILSQLLTSVLLLVTFGFACPPLAVVIIISVMFKVFYWNLIIVKYLDTCFNSMSSDAGNYYSQNIALLDECCKRVWQIPRSCITLLGLTALIFCSMFVSDIAGDEVGFTDSYYIPLSMTLIGIIIAIALNGYHQRYYPMWIYRSAISYIKSTSVWKYIMKENDDIRPSSPSIAKLFPYTDKNFDYKVDSTKDVITTDDVLSPNCTTTEL